MSAAIQLTFEQRANRQICTKFTAEEYLKLQEICVERGQKAQDFIRSCIFNGPEHRPLMEAKICQKIYTELNRMGVNINQISRHMNSGIRKDWYDSFDSIARDVLEMKLLLGRHNVRA